MTISTTKPALPELLEVIDDVGNFIGNLNNGDVTDDTTPTLKGTGLPGYMVVIYVNGVQFDTVAVETSGKWTYTINSPGLVENQQSSITISQVDPIGNESGQTTPFVLIVDTTPPNPIDNSSLMLWDDVGLIVGPVVKGSLIDDAQPEYSGTAQADVKFVKIYDNGILLGTTVVKTDGTWSYTPAPLGGGSHAFTASAMDAAGNESIQTSIWDFNLEANAPSAPSITLVYDNYGIVTGQVDKGQTTDDVTLTISGEGQAGSTVTVYSNGVAVGSTVVDGNQKWSLDTADLLQDGNVGADNVVNITAKQVDGIGQESPETGIYKVIIDQTAPEAPLFTVKDDVAPIEGLITDGMTTDDGTPTFVGTAEANSKVVIVDNGTVISEIMADDNGTWSFTPRYSFNRWLTQFFNYCNGCSW